MVNERPDDGESSTPTRRKALLMTGALGTGSLVLPGITQASQSESNSEDALTAEEIRTILEASETVMMPSEMDIEQEIDDPEEIDLEDGEVTANKSDGTTAVYSADEARPAKNIRIRSNYPFVYELACLSGVCIEIGFRVETWYVGFELRVGGQPVYDGGIGRDEDLYQISGRWKGVGITLGIDAAFVSSNQVAVTVYGEACVFSLCRDLELSQTLPP